MAVLEHEGVVRQSGGVRVQDGDPMVVWLWGEHDLSTAASVSSALTSAVGVGDVDVVVDLADVTFMDASILRGLVGSSRSVAVRGHRLSVRSPQRNARRLLEICDLVDLIDPTEAEPVGGGPPEQGARTALETWIEVLPSARPAPSQGDRGRGLGDEPAFPDPHRRPVSPTRGGPQRARSADRDG